MTPCTLSKECYKWLGEDGGWKDGHLVVSRECLISEHGKSAQAYLARLEKVLIFDPLAEAPGLFFVEWGKLELYERGP